MNIEEGFEFTNGADASYNNSAALRYCCTKHNLIEITSLLLESGADVKANKYEALINASNSGSRTIINKILKYI